MLHILFHVEVPTCAAEPPSKPGEIQQRRGHSSYVVWSTNFTKSRRLRRQHSEVSPEKVRKVGCSLCAGPETSVSAETRQKGDTGSSRLIGCEGIVVSPRRYDKNV